MAGGRHSIQAEPLPGLPRGLQSLGREDQRVMEKNVHVLPNLCLCANIKKYDFFIQALSFLNSVVHRNK